MAPTTWIIHREPTERAALARLAGAADDTILGHPDDALFESAVPADVVVLAPVGDYERELELAHRVQARSADCRWVLLCEAAERAEVERVFDTLASTIVPLPPTQRELRAAIARAHSHSPSDPLSSRRGRSALTARFALWFGDRELPDFMRTLDPRMAHVPLLVRGEPGTGRSLLARYAHAHGGAPRSALLKVGCADLAHGAELMDAMVDAASLEGERAELAWTIWLAEVDQLQPALQRRVADWIHYGLPPGVPQPGEIHWLATAGDEPHVLADPGADLVPELARPFAPATVRLAPLRERRESIDRFVADTAAVWCSSRGESTRMFGEEALGVLREQLWPRNVAELEALVLRSLAASTASPLQPIHLRFENRLFEPAGLAVATATTPTVPTTPTAPSAPSADDGLIELGLADALEPFSPAEEELETLEPLDEALELDDEPALETELIELDGEPALTDPDAWSRLVGAIAHEIRNPLVSIRTFSELLAEHYEDEEFRTRFANVVGADVRRIEGVLNQLQGLSDVGDPKREPVDMATLLDGLLDQARDEIQRRRLLVLKELDRERPMALADPHQLRQALSGLVTKALELVPERGDFYLASRTHTPDSGAEPTMRVLLRFHNPSPTSAGAVGPSVADTALEFIVAEGLIRAQGGTLAIDTTDTRETMIVIDLPSPG